MIKYSVIAEKDDGLAMTWNDLDVRSAIDIARNLSKTWNRVVVKQDGDVVWESTQPAGVSDDRS